MNRFRTHTKPKKAVREVVGKKALKSVHAQNFAGDSHRFSFSGTLDSSNYDGLSSIIPAPILVNAWKSSDETYNLRVAYLNPMESVTRLVFNDLPAPAVSDVLRSLESVDLRVLETTGWPET